ncbi:hypothetical protein [Roseimaritima sediminicola]|uniref:hypothetical protein n=1 Tax=Roseimaritima sediminicola TaxID=2662066 RepID=UPI001F2D99DC|nr:hypothetical protein [Roseimaritima sediminicola]
MEREIKRRDVMGSMLGLGAGGLAGAVMAQTAQAADRGGGASVPSEGSTPNVYCGELRLSPGGTRTHQLRQFVRTNVCDGHVLCTLTEQDPNNPAITAVFAAAARRDGVWGAEITVHLLAPPRGDVQLSLLHIGAAAPARSAIG